VTDINVGDYLKLFTFISLDEILAILEEHNLSPEKRHAQKVLAAAVTTIVHGEAETHAVTRVTELLFTGGDVSALVGVERDILLNNAPTFTVAGPVTIVDVLVKSGLATSNREAREFITQGAVTYKNQKCTTTEEIIMVPEGELATLKRGKKQFVVLVGATLA
jgi:tyrosyl-tRNA synthetase